MIAVDLGNTRAKFGFFQSHNHCQEAFPVPDSVLALTSADFASLTDWLDGIAAPTTWYITRTGNFPWNDWQTRLTTFRSCDRFEELVNQEIPILIDVEFPEKVGIDRLLSVYAASCWKSLPENGLLFEKNTRILVVDIGTAITVDLLSGEDYFAGGAILPGLNVVSEALANISPRLPKIPVNNLSFAVYPGKNTEEALAAGIYWGAIGAIRQFHQIVETTLHDAGLPSQVPLFLVGGNAEHLHTGLSLFVKSENLFLFPNLVLSGIALTVRNRPNIPAA
ncbi:MAG: type III pantothenate kinase [Planctomycetaceae bacterium]|jgi:type III pantothenate kinase|nr:type III pantothenate kinase [Planctomycetaceae bacterium]